MGFGMIKGTNLLLAAAMCRTARAAVHLIQNKMRKTTSWSLPHVCSAIGSQ